MLKGLQHFHFHFLERLQHFKKMWIVEGYSLVGLLTRLVGAHIDMHIAQQEGILILFYLLILHTVHFEDDKLLQALYNKEKTNKFSFFQFTLSW